MINFFFRPRLTLSWVITQATQCWKLSFFFPSCIDACSNLYWLKERIPECPQYILMICYYEIKRNTQKPLRFSFQSWEKVERGTNTPQCSLASFTFRVCLRTYPRKFSTSIMFRGQQQLISPSVTLCTWKFSISEGISFQGFFLNYVCNEANPFQPSLKGKVFIYYLSPSPRLV